MVTTVRRPKPVNNLSIITASRISHQFPLDFAAHGIDVTIHVFKGGELNKTVSCICSTRICESLLIDILIDDHHA